jgi:MbtH protein
MMLSMQSGRGKAQAPVTRKCRWNYFSEEHSMSDAKTNIEAEEQYTVLVNDEEQYGLHPSDLDIPVGWRETGMRGAETECMAYVDSVWTDMRPLSLRRAMDQSTGESATGPDPATP